MVEAATIERIEDELNQITNYLEQRLERRSRWNGNVGLIAEADFKGKKPFSCHILIAAVLAEQEIRWRTLLHEALHGFSAGYIQSDYMALLGWEEGVIEYLQRLYRPGLLSALGVQIEDAVFRIEEDVQAYNRYIAALEAIRAVLEAEAEPFYIELLQTPIKERPSYVFGLGNGLPGQKRLDFVRIYSASNSVLRR